MSVLTVRVSPELHARLSAEAGRRRVTRSSLVRHIIERALEDAAGPPASCADVMRDLIGCVDSGRSDVSTNAELLEEAVVADWERAHSGRDC